MKRPLPLTTYNAIHYFATWNGFGGIRGFLRGHRGFLVLLNPKGLLSTTCGPGLTLPFAWLGLTGTDEGVRPYTALLGLAGTDEGVRPYTICRRGSEGVSRNDA